LSSKTPRLRRCKSSEGNSTKNSQAKRKWDWTVILY
jgi:hypothetical protein